MSLEIQISVLEAKFEEIINRIVTRRGKQRKKHIAELKSFFLKNVNKDRLWGIQENREEHEIMRKKFEEMKIKLAAIKLSFTASEDIRNQWYNRLNKVEEKLNKVTQESQKKDITIKLLENKLASIKAVVNIS